MTLISPKFILDQNILRLPKEVNVGDVLQPNGIDLSISTLREIESASSPLIIGDKIKTQHKLDVEVYPSFTGGYRLGPNKQYRVETGYELSLPEDMVAYIFTRSTLNRNGILVGSGLWDSGYHGPVGTTLYSFQDIEIHLPCRVAQIVFFKAESSHLYAGAYNIPSMK